MYFLLSILFNLGGKIIKIWLPHLWVSSGSDVFTERLAKGLSTYGHEVIKQPLSKLWQYFPWRLKAMTPPHGTQVTLAIYQLFWYWFSLLLGGTINLVIFYQPFLFYYFLASRGLIKFTAYCAGREHLILRALGKAVFVLLSPLIITKYFIINAYLSFPNDLCYF